MYLVVLQTIVYILFPSNVALDKFLTFLRLSVFKLKRGRGWGINLFLVVLLLDYKGEACDPL